MYYNNFNNRCCKGSCQNTIFQPVAGPPGPRGFQGLVGPRGPVGPPGPSGSIFTSALTATVNTTTPVQVFSGNVIPLNYVFPGTTIGPNIQFNAASNTVTLLADGFYIFIWSFAVTNSEPTSTNAIDVNITLEDNLTFIVTASHPSLAANDTATVIGSAVYQASAGDVIRLINNSVFTANPASGSQITLIPAAIAGLPDATTTNGWLTVIQIA